MTSYKRCDSLLNYGEASTKDFYPIYYNFFLICSAWTFLSDGQAMLGLARQTSNKMSIISVRDVKNGARPSIPNADASEKVGIYWKWCTFIHFFKTKHQILASQFPLTCWFQKFIHNISIRNAVYFFQRLRNRSLSLPTRVGTGIPARAARNS